jgi:hypothetical protein
MVNISDKENKIDFCEAIFEFIPIKKVELLPPFLPQIYHKLNLLMLW